MSRTLRILLSLGLVLVVLALADWHLVLDVLRRVKLEWVAGAVSLALLDRLLVNFRWRSLLTASGVHLGFWRTFRVQLAANFVGSFLPSSLGVDAMRVTALCRAGQPAGSVIAAGLADRVTHALITLILASTTILILARTRIPPAVASVIFLSALMGLLVCASCLHPAVRRWGGVHLLPRVPHRLRQTAARIVEALHAYRHDSRLLARVVGMTLVILTVRIMFAKAIVLACGADVSFADLLLLIPILWIVLMLPITVGGLGVQDMGYVVLMSFIGVPAPVAVSMSLLEHVVVRVAMLPGAFFLKEFSKSTRRVSPPSFARGGYRKSLSVPE